MEFLQLYAIGFALGFAVSLAAQLWNFTKEFKYAGGYSCFDASDAVFMVSVSLFAGCLWFLSVPIILLAGLLYFTIKLIMERKR